MVNRNKEDRIFRFRAQQFAEDMFACYNESERNLFIKGAMWAREELAKKPKSNFVNWMLTQKTTDPGHAYSDTPVSDFIGDALSDPDFPLDVNSRTAVLKYLKNRLVHDDVIKAFEETWTLYQKFKAKK